MSRGQPRASRPDGANGAVADYMGMVARHRPWQDGTARRESISFQEFRQIVRRHRPSDLLPALAELSLAPALVDTRSGPASGDDVKPLRDGR